MSILGLDFSETLNWNQHTQKISLRIAQYIGFIARHSHYLKKSTLKMLYFAYVHSNILYALIIWGDPPQHRLKEILFIYKRFLRLIY